MRLYSVWALDYEHQCVVGTYVTREEAEREMAYCKRMATRYSGMGSSYTFEVRDCDVGIPTAGLWVEFTSKGRRIETLFELSCGADLDEHGARWDGDGKHANVWTRNGGSARRQFLASFDARMEAARKGSA